jgi:hypothetical protein
MKETMISDRSTALEPFIILFQNKSSTMLELEIEFIYIS